MSANERALEQIKAARLPDCDWILDLERLIDDHGTRIRRVDFVRTTGGRFESGDEPASKAADRTRYEAQRRRWQRWKRRCRARRLGHDCERDEKIFVLDKRRVYELCVAFWINRGVVF